MDVDLGIVEGFFGRPWSWAGRREVMQRLAPAGYRFYLYAPKADGRLRRRWREPYGDEDLQALADLAAACRASGVRFGVGLSPFEAWLDFGQEARAALNAKLRAFEEIGVQDLAILFDDMKGDLSDLADRQGEIIDFAAQRTSASRLIVCPSYYSDDPTLDRVFGARPGGYLERLGQRLDPAIEMFWTGEEVCSREFSPGHLDEVATRLNRKPFLWDNYPVNDGPRMSQHLHLRAFTGRPAAIAASIAGHAVNPALQPLLSCIPALTLARSYAEAERYRYGAAFRDAARSIAGEPLAAMLEADIAFLQDVGRDRLGERLQTLRARYAAVDHPAAREVAAWLDGDDFVPAEIVKTQ